MTTELQENNCGPNKGKNGYGAWVMAQQYNHLLASPRNRTLKHANLAAQLAIGQFGISPKKMGRPSNIPDVLKKVAVLQAVLLRVNGETLRRQSKS